MNPRQIEAFRAVASTGTVTAAASALHVSQPAVSRLIADLEHRLRLALFTRQRGRLHLTADGAALLREVDRHFVGLQAIEEAAQRIERHGPGHLRIISIPSLSSGVLPMAIAQHLEEHPETAFTLDTDTTDRITSRLHTGAYDVGFTAGATTSGHAVTGQVIASRPWLCAFAPDHALANRQRVTVDELIQHPLVGFSPDMSLRSRIDQMFQDAGHQPRYALSAQTIESICALVDTSGGAAIIHPYAQHVATLRGLAVATLNAAATLELAAVTPEQPASASVTSQFIDRVHDAFLPKSC